MNGHRSQEGEYNGELRTLESLARGEDILFSFKNWFLIFTQNSGDEKVFQRTFGENNRFGCEFVRVGWWVER